MDAGEREGRLSASDVGEGVSVCCAPNEVSAMTLVGELEGMVAVVVDDMADTCGILVRYG